MKRFSAFILVIVLMICFVACKKQEQTKPSADTDTPPVFKIGMVFVSSQEAPESVTHVESIKKVMKEHSLSDEQLVCEYSVRADDDCYEKIAQLVDNGCDLVISNSNSHQDYMNEAATDYPDTDFVVIGGDTAAASRLGNFYNAYTKVYEARYLSGVVAGMKLKQLDKTNAIADINLDDDGNVKLGYVGTLPSAQASSAYSAFYLGVKSVYSDVALSVQFTNKRYDMQAEIDTANQLIEQGCVVIAQHSSSVGVASAVKSASENGKVCYCVGFDSDMSTVSPDNALVSAKIEWSVYYQELLDCVLNDKEIEQDWCKGYEDLAVSLTELNLCCADGTQERLDMVLTGMKSGEVQVFDTQEFTRNGKKVNTVYVTDTDKDDIPDEDQAIFDGFFHESYFRSAPYFTIEIDGITLLN